MLSNLIGKSENKILNIGVKLFDFDTGLTRADISHIKNKVNYWEKRIIEVESYRNSPKYKEQSLLLIEEMMEDPVMNKMAKKFGVSGIKEIYKILSSI